MHDYTEQSLTPIALLTVPPALTTHLRPTRHHRLNSRCSPRLHLCPHSPLKLRLAKHRARGMRTSIKRRCLGSRILPWKWNGTM